MQRWTADPSLDDLLLLDGYVLVVDPDGGYWVKFVVTRVPASSGKPHGLDYSLTLHDAKGNRLIGFDNAHPAKAGAAFDHQHAAKSVKPYQYRSAAGLLADFWGAVDRELKKRGVST
jgi:hypothetical protein